MQRGGRDQFPIWMGSRTFFAGKLNSDVGKEFYVWLKFQIQSIGRCQRWRITVSRDDKAGSSTVNLWTIWQSGRNKETRTVDSRREQSSRLAHAKLDCRLFDPPLTLSGGCFTYSCTMNGVLGYLFNLGDSGVRRLGLNVLLNVLFLGEVIFT